MERKQPLRAAEWAVLLLAAGLYVIMMLLLTADTSGGDAAGRGMGRALALFLHLPLWMMLAVLYLLLGRRGVLPRSAGIVLLFVASAALLAAYSVAGGSGEVARWMVAVIALLPLLAATFGFWAAADAATLAAERRPVAIGVGIAAIAICAPVYIHWFAWIADAPERAANLRAIEARIAEADAAFVAAEQARFEAFGPGRPIEEFVPFLDPVDPRYAEALRRMRELPDRQNEAIRFLDRRSEFDRLEFQEWGLSPDAALCRSYRAALARRLARYHDPAHSLSPLELPRQIPTMRWLTDEGCDLRQAAATLHAQLEPNFEAGDPMLAAVRAIRDGR